MLAQIDDRLADRLVVPAEIMGDTIELVVRPADLTSVMRALREDPDIVLVGDDGEILPALHLVDQPVLGPRVQRREGQGQQADPYQQPGRHSVHEANRLLANPDQSFGRGSLLFGGLDEDLLHERITLAHGGGHPGGRGLDLFRTQAIGEIDAEVY